MEKLEVEEQTRLLLHLSALPDREPHGSHVIGNEGQHLNVRGSSTAELRAYAARAEPDPDDDPSPDLGPFRC